MAAAPPLDPVPTLSPPRPAFPPTARLRRTTELFIIWSSLPAALASAIAWRKLPAPLSFMFETRNVAARAWVQMRSRNDARTTCLRLMIFMRDSPFLFLTSRGDFIIVGIGWIDSR